MPRTPVGHKDNLAACSLSKSQMDKAMEIVHKHGCTWWYEFNDKKSGVRENKCNASDIVFQAWSS